MRASWRNRAKLTFCCATPRVMLFICLLTSEELIAMARYPGFHGWEGRSLEGYSRGRPAGNEMC